MIDSKIAGKLALVGGKFARLPALMECPGYHSHKIFNTGLIFYWNLILFHFKLDLSVNFEFINEINDKYVKTNVVLFPGTQTATSLKKMIHIWSCIFDNDEKRFWKPNSL